MKAIMDEKEGEKDVQKEEWLAHRKEASAEMTEYI